MGFVCIDTGRTCIICKTWSLTVLNNNKNKPICIALTNFEKNASIWTHGQMSENVSKTPLVSAVAPRKVVQLHISAENPSFWTLYPSKIVFCVIMWNFKENRGEGVGYGGGRGKIWERQEEKNKTELVIK